MVTISSATLKRSRKATERVEKENKRLKLLVKELEAKIDTISAPF